MEGKHAPELACGDFWTRLEELFTSTAQEIAYLCRNLDAASRDIVLSDFQIARGVMDSELHIKLAHWSLIPWLLAGACHSDPSKARAAMRQCLEQYDRHPDPALHHPQSVELLGRDSPLREWSIAFANGASWQDMPDEFIFELLPLKFIPVSERLIESRHGLVQHRISGHHKCRHPATFSLAWEKF